ncbi:NAD(P)/FAD-dependent oxidoreductase [Leucothrix arctica]|uniref:FAD-dependent oxidoreductase n=1 Tax=Leucothrix arctica TaxID=1481894 RepID=A0A317C9Z7_9GAMM|nr:FAD-dependent oxidoreductase [Leucothrix arctica]PWQ95356.1 FAD-dependent oxidoreductase [Leucothrix arctica]
MSNIAIIGSGISGLICGHKLSPNHQVTVFEANDYIGGHTATIDVEVDGKPWAIDTGFIVFNDHTYPHFQGLMDELKVEYQETNMSFSVENASTGLVYNGNTLSSLFAQRSNFFKMKFWRLISEILRFNKRCKALNKGEIDPELSVKEFLDKEDFSPYFAENYILPMAAAIWSASLGEVEAFPLRFFIRFFDNHGLLNVVNRPQWFSIKGGSREYIPAVTAKFKDDIQLSTPVSKVLRTDDGVEITLGNGDVQHFDEVIFACHSNQALALLGDASEAEQSVLGAIPYRQNEVVLHTDRNMLPEIPEAVACWNYHLSGVAEDKAVAASVTYSMNLLQCLPEGAPEFCVSLNTTDRIDPSKILRTFHYDHPVFSRDMVAAQGRRNEICGQNKTHFCGAYWYSGFHEDGVRSAVDVALRFENA